MGVQKNDAADGLFEQLLGWLWARGKGSARVLRWHPWLIAVVLATAGVLVVAGPVAVALVAIAGAVGLVVWWNSSPGSFERWVVARSRASWRREWVYRRRWRKVMWLHNLAVRFDGDELVPRLGRVACMASSDAVLVRLADGQHPHNWMERAPNLAETFGALECRVSHPKPHWVRLELVFRRDLPVVEALRPPARPNLDALAIGRRDDGKPWLLRLASVVHVLIVGAVGSGKGSVLWSIIRSLASAVRDGWVQLWVCDPKGGMELGHGPADKATGEPSCPMFSRFAADPDGIADLLEDAVVLMVRRARRYSGKARKHRPSLLCPSVVIVVDELAALTAYASERDRHRIGTALRLLLSQGRAVGVHVIAAVQDPRKSTVQVRDLIPYRVGLRMVDADQVDAALGQTAWHKGARCEEIPVSAPGCAWEFDDGTPEPNWVRASWVSDDDIAQMATDYPPPRRQATADHAHGVIEALCAAGAAWTDTPPADKARAGGDRPVMSPALASVGR